MKLSTVVNHAGDPRKAVARARDLDKAGIDMIWVPELYGFDAISILGALASTTEHAELGTGIIPVYSRTPTLLGMTAAGLDALSGGRFVLGLGVSGPQVVEGWHGIAYRTPLQHTEEAIEICRKVWRREPVVHQGPAYTLPLPPSEGTGLGKPLKLINHPVRESIPIYVASLGPKNVEMTARVADGWIPTFFHPDKAREVWAEDVARGKKARSSDLGDLEIVAGGTVCICDEDRAQQIRDAARPQVALYVGGMGARGKNFYNDLFRRYGYEAEAEAIQDAFLDGRRAEAEAAVPAEYLEAVTLVGDAGRVRDRVEAYREAGVTRLSITPAGPNHVELIEQLKDWAS